MAAHNTRQDAWFVYKGKVYNFTEFIEDHPGGEEEFDGFYGKDITKAFKNASHSSNADNLMKKILIGVLEQPNKVKKEEEQSESGLDWSNN